MRLINKTSIASIFQYSDNRKRNFIYLFIILLIIGIAGIIFKIRTRANYEDQTQFQNSRILKRAEYMRRIKKERDSIDLISTDIKLSDINVVAINGKILKLKSLVSEPRLVYRFSTHSCKTCVENDFKILKILSETIGLDKIFILTNFENLKFLKIYMKNESLPFDCYNYSETINIPIEKNSYNPYFFVLNHDLKVAFAHTSYPEHTFDSLYFKQLRILFKQ